MSDELKYKHIARFVLDQPWAILPSMLATIVELVRFRASGGMLTHDDIAARVAAAQNGPRQGAMQTGAVAVIAAYGPISQRQSMMSDFSGGTSIEQLSATFRSAMSDPQIDAIVFDVDSPGGTVDGIPELAAEIRAARGTKPIVAVANGMAASAAYWFATACDEVVVTPSGSVGSIGIFTAHQDLSAAAEKEGVKTTLISAGKYKTEGSPWEPLGDEAKSNIQDQVDQFYGMFVADVARGRNVPVDSVRGGYGQGRVVLAKQALAQGMVDRIDTLDNTVRRVARGVIAGRQQLAAQAWRASLFAADPPLMCSKCDHAANCDCTTCSCNDPMHTMGATAPVTGQAFSDRLALVTAEAEGLAAHASDRAAMRAKHGRGLSASDRDGLRQVAGTLLALAGEPEREPEPEPIPDPSWRKGAALRLALARAQYDI